MAPGFSAEALEVFKGKANVRVLQIRPARLATRMGPGPQHRETSNALALAC
jgi:AICAR transformylase/IMP cyclohydrolase PurH